MTGKSPAEQIEDLTAAVENLTAAAEIASAHIENLIQRVYVLETGHEWDFIARCWDCEAGVNCGDDQEEAGRWCEQHQHDSVGHVPYVDTKIRS